MGRARRHRPPMSDVFFSSAARAPPFLSVLSGSVVTMRELHLFAGAGGGILGSLLLGHRPVCAVEIDPYCRAVLQARRDEGWLPAEMEIHDDVTKFDGHAWRGRIDLVAGGFPCQDISVAGKGAGLAGKRSGLWWEMHRIIREVGPRFVFVENVPAITSRGLDVVLGSLADLGFDAEWCVLSAADVGAPHLRKRWWCLARHSDYQSKAEVRSVCEGQNAELVQGRAQAAESGRGGDAGESSNAPCVGLEGRQPADVPDSEVGQSDGRGRGELEGEAGAWRCGDAAAVASGADDPDAEGSRLAARDGQRGSQGSRFERGGEAGADAGATERQLGRAADGMATWLDRTAAGYWSGEWETQPRLAQGQAHRAARLRALGNGQVPQTAAMAFALLMHRYRQRGQV